MNLNPQDIQQQKFKKRFRGFDVQEVDSFLSEVADNFLAIMHENKRLRERIDELDILCEQHLAEEKDMKAAILSAQRVTDKLQKKSEQETADYQTKLKAFEEEIKAKREDLEAEKKKNQEEIEALIAKTKEEMKTRQQAMDEEFAKTTAAREKRLQVMDAEFGKARVEKEKTLQEIAANIRKTREEVKSLQEEIARLGANRDETRTELEKSGRELTNSREELEKIKKTKSKVTEELRAILTKHLQLLEPAPPVTRSIEPLGEELFDDSLDIIFETEDGESLEQGLDENILMELFQGVELSNEEDVVGRSEGGEEDLTDLYETIKMPENSQNTLQELSGDLLFSGEDQIPFENNSAEENQKPSEKHD